MDNVFSGALQKVVDALNAEKIEYMIVGGFAVSYHNRARTTNDIDLVLQIYPGQIKGLLNHFPQWKDFETSFMDDVKRGMMFNIIDFDTGIRYDFMTFQDTIYSRTAFDRREAVVFWGVNCFVSSKEDLIISKLKWYNMSPSEKQMEDLRFLLLDASLNQDYLIKWTQQLKLETYGLLGK
jgi:predicted nucleotidyltransferase